MTEKKLNKPFNLPTSSKKKYGVYVKSEGKVKKITFGFRGMDDFRSGTATQKQRKSYLARAKGIKNKQGQLTYKIKTSPNYWSVKYGWKG